MLAGILQLYDQWAAVTPTQQQVLKVYVKIHQYQVACHNYLGSVHTNGTNVLCIVLCRGVVWQACFT